MSNLLSIARQHAGLPPKIEVIREYPPENREPIIFCRHSIDTGEKCMTCHLAPTFGTCRLGHWDGMKIPRIQCSNKRKTCKYFEAE